MVAAAKARGMAAIWVYLPGINETATPTELFEVASEAGFSIINLQGIYSDLDPATLQLAAWDDHPNAAAHQLIAEKLYTELKQNASALGIPLSHP
jgi:hypothetical protein